MRWPSSSVPLPPTPRLPELDLAQLDVAAAIFRSACRPSWHAAVRTFSRPRRSCTRQPRPSALPTPISIRTSTSPRSIGQQSIDVGSACSTRRATCWSLAADSSRRSSMAARCAPRSVRRSMRCTRAPRTTSRPCSRRSARSPIRCEALDHGAEQLQAQAHAEEAARDNVDLTRQSYKEGNVGVLQVLDAERRYQQARLGYVRAQAQRYMDTAQLFLALGGSGVSPDIQG